jgi:predicted ATPase/DNA-binding SARP family transcriptional activator
MLIVKTLGGLKLSVNGEPMGNLGSHKAEAILVYLAVKTGPQNRNTLAALFWPDSAENQALTSLRVALSLLRRDLEEYLEISRQAVEIKPGTEVYLDLADLILKLSNGQMEQVLEIFQGDFLEGFFIRDCLEFEDWRLLQQERVRRLVISGLHAAISTSIEEKDYQKGQHYAQRLLELDPLDELAHRKSMLIYALDGQRTRSLDQYDHCEAILQAELGVEPSQETRLLYTQIQRGERPGHDTSLMPPADLPLPQTSFIGREEELAQISGMINDPNCRLLSLVGPGGIGKSRLALRCIIQCYHSFVDGSYFIPLEELASPDYLVHTIANCIHFGVDTLATQLDAEYQLLDYLKNRSMLLVLDGFEHVIAGARLVSDITHQATAVKVLVTSRQRLNLQGEWVLPVIGLPVPSMKEPAESDQSNALHLFTERARQANLKFSLSEPERGSALHICQMVEGMPLAIELAAAWTEVLSLGEIEAGIQENLDFLSSSKADIEQKHHSLRAAIDGSWQILDQEHREAYCKVSVFKNGFDREAALEVARVNLSQLSSLLNRSLLSRDKSGRFTMHSLLRRYASEKLDKSRLTSEEVHYAHYHYYTEFLHRRETDLDGPNFLQIWQELDLELENIRTAVYWAVTHRDAREIRRIFNGLFSFYVVKGWHEGRDTFRDIALMRKESLLSQNNLDWVNDPIYACARAHQAFLMCNLSQIRESDELSTECLKALRDLGFMQELSECIHNLGVNASFRGEYEYAMEHLEEAINLGRESGNIIWYSYLLWYGHTCFLLGEYDRGLESLQKCYELYEHKGILWGMAFAMSKMGLAEDGLGDFHQSKQYHQQALAIFDKISNQAGKGYALSRMSMSAYFLEEYSQSINLAQEGYQIFLTLGHHWGVCTSLCRLGFGYIGMGKLQDAKSCFWDALQQSRKYQMIPLSLYALAGISAVKILSEGEHKSALELFRYVNHHPQIPEIYLQQTARWFKPEYLEMLKNETALPHQNNIEPVIEVINRVLKTGGFGSAPALSGE